MRVLLVSHLYPPDHTAGTEVYTEALAHSLVSRGHEVHVFATTKDVGRVNLSLEEREQDGVIVHELVQNLYYRRIQETWDNPAVEQRFSKVLKRVGPRVVHIQHLMYLSAGLPRMSVEAGARVLATLHDFGLECARFGQLVDADGELCHEVLPERCGRCLARFDWRQSDLQRRVGKGLAEVRRWTGVNLAPLALRASRGKPAPAAEGTDPKVLEPRELSALEAVSVARTGALRAAYGLAERIFSPSAFLAERAVAAGLDPERVEVLPTGIQRGRLRPQSRTPRPVGAPLRIQFLGTFVPLKGAHVLMEAWEQLGNDLRRGAELHLHGPTEHAPAYAEELRQRASEAGASLGGRLDRDQVEEALGRADLVVVPSLWFENRPLVILEALQAGAAVIASDLGALPELVTEARGWRFRPGDAGDLAALLRRLIREPELVEARRGGSGGAQLPDWEETVDRIEAAYRAGSSAPG